MWIVLCCEFAVGSIFSCFLSILILICFGYLLLFVIVWVIWWWIVVFCCFSVCCALRILLFTFDVLLFIVAILACFVSYFGVLVGCFLLGGVNV